MNIIADGNCASKPLKLMSTHTNGIGHFDDSVYLFEIDLYERK